MAKKKNKKGFFRKFIGDDRTEDAKRTDLLGKTQSSVVQGEGSIYDTRCISLISNIVAKSSIKAYRLVNGVPQEVSETETQLLLANPSPGKTMGDLLSTFTKDILVHNRFWSIYDEELNVWFVLRPDNVTYELENGILSKFKNGNKELSVDNIVFAQANGTEDDWSINAKNIKGSAKFNDLDTLYEIENSARVSAQARLKNRAAIDGIFGVDKETMLTEEEKETIEKGLVARYGGAPNSGKPFFAQGLTYTETGMTKTSDEYTGYIGTVRDEILAYRGVPFFLLTSTPNSTLYSSAAALANMYTSQINPIIELFVEMLNLQIVPRLDDEGVYFDYTDQTPIDITELQQTLNRMYETGAISLNEYRVPLGLTPVKNGNTLIDGTVVPEAKGVKNVITEMQEKQRAERINRTILKSKKIERDVEKVTFKNRDVDRFGMLSVKAGIDNNPGITKADRIAGATMKKKKKK